VVSLQLPPLQDRKEDILPLAEHFLRKFSKRNNKVVRCFSSEVIEFIMNYSWPGNVRELENMIEHGVILAKHKEIRLGDLPQDSCHPSPPEGKAIEDVMRNHIIHVLEETKGNISEAAKLLGIQRMTLYNKLKKYNYTVNKIDA
jgi:two-component system response regulator HydG